MTTHRRIFRMTLRSNPKYIGRVETFLNKVNQAVHLNEIQLHKLMVSVTEAANNAILHGNKMDPDKRVRITCEIRPDWLIFVIADEGKGFNPDKISSPLRKRNLLRDSGRGVFLMKTLMDRVEYNVSPMGVRVQLWLDRTK